jgi:hypothetical protein
MQVQTVLTCGKLSIFNLSLSSHVTSSHIFLVHQVCLAVFAFASLWSKIWSVDAVLLPEHANNLRHWWTCAICFKRTHEPRLTCSAFLIDI